ncbi:hypothetical protein [Azospirillum sp. sgz302134]
MQPTTFLAWCLTKGTAGNRAATEEEARRAWDLEQDRRSAAQARCPACGKMVTVKAGKLATHGPGTDGALTCRGSGQLAAQVSH